MLWFNTRRAYLFNWENIISRVDGKLCAEEFITAMMWECICIKHVNDLKVVLSDDRRF